jgi:hypothetical protein
MKSTAVGSGATDRSAARKSTCAVDKVLIKSGAPCSTTLMPVVPQRDTENLQPLGVAGLSTQLWLAPPGQNKPDRAPTNVSLFDQGLVQVLEASVTGLEPGKPYVLALSIEASGAGVLQPLQGFMTNPAGSAIVNAIGPIRELVRGEDKVQRRYLVIAPGAVGQLGAPVQVQTE